MADKKLYYDKIYGLVMQCRKSGLSYKQWCINNDIAPSTVVVKLFCNTMT